MKMIAATLLMFSMSVAPALAADQGFFISADLGAASYSNAPLLQCDFGCGLALAFFGEDTEFGSSGSASIGGGYHYNQNLGVEAGYTNIGDSESSRFSVSGSSTTSSSETLSGSSIRIVAVGTLALSKSFDVFAKLGLARTTLDYKVTQTVNGVTTSGSASGTGTNPLFGLGVQYNFNQQWGIRAQYENLGKVQVGSAGAAYNSDVGIAVYSVGGVFSF